MVSCICISLYLGRIISPIDGFSISISFVTLSNHFGNVTLPVAVSYSTRLCWFKSVRILCSLSGEIPISLASFLTFFVFSSSMIASSSAAVSIGSSSLPAY